MSEDGHVGGCQFGNPVVVACEGLFAGASQLFDRLLAQNVGSRAGAESHDGELNQVS